jgi:hypothetical protein
MVMAISDSSGARTLRAVELLAKQEVAAKIKNNNSWLRFY